MALLLALLLASLVAGSEIAEPSIGHSSAALAECLRKSSGGIVERWTKCSRTVRDREAAKAAAEPSLDKAETQRISPIDSGEIPGGREVAPPGIPSGGTTEGRSEDEGNPDEARESSSEEISGDGAPTLLVTTLLSTLLLLYFINPFRSKQEEVKEKVAETKSVDRVEPRTLCAPLGLAFATILVKVLHGENSFQESLLEDELPHLLETEIQEALSPVLNEQSEEFATALKKSFVSYFKLLSRGQQRKPSSTISHNSPQPQTPTRSYNSPQRGDVKLLQNSHRLHIQNRTFKVSEKLEDDAVSTNQDVDVMEQSVQVEDFEVTKELSVHSSAAAGETGLASDSRLQEQPLAPDSVPPYAVGTTTTSSHISHAFLNVLERSVEAQERLNHLTWMGLVEKGLDRSRRISMKEESIQLAVKTTDLMKESNELRRSQFEFEMMEAENQAIQAGCRELCKRCSDDLGVGMLVMLLSVGYGTWMQCPKWLSDLRSACRPEIKDKPRFAWQYMSWGLSIAEELVKSSACLFRGALGLVLGLIGLLFFSFMVKRLLSTSPESMPGSMLIVIGGCLFGYFGKMTVDLLGGDGFAWLVLWQVLCLCHAASSFYASGLLRHFQHGRCSALREIGFHFFLAMALPLTMGLAAFPEAWLWLTR